MKRYGLDHSFAEHLADGIVHGLGVAAALIGATALVVWAALSVPAEKFTPLLVYAIGLTATFGFSAAYNMTLHARARAFLRRLDHAAIFVMIAGTYTPLALIGLGGAEGARLAIATWVIAGIGSYLKLFHLHRFYRLTFVLYLAQGWLGVIAVKPLVSALDPLVLGLLAAGGVIYSAGTLFHWRDDWAYNRAIWHGLVLAAAASHYVAVLQVARA